MAENKEIKKYPAAIFIHSLSHHLVLALLCRSLEIDRERKIAKKERKLLLNGVHERVLSATLVAAMGRYSKG